MESLKALLIPRTRSTQASALAALSLALYAGLAIRKGPADALGLTGAAHFLWWSAAQGIFLFALPMAFARWLWGWKPARTGLALPPPRDRHWGLYLLLLFPVLAAILLASRSSSFQALYPFDRGASESWAKLGVWEALYAFQFLSLEYFFRGFLLNALAEDFGDAAIFLALPAYVCFHIAKPLPEILASILAGLALGALARLTRSIWGGVLVHVAAGWAMDALALTQSHRWPG